MRIKPSAIDMIQIKPAEDNHREAIAFCIAEGFERDFSVFSKDTDRVASALAPGIRTENFYVAEQDGEVIAVTGISDCAGRAVYTDRKAYQKNFGWLKGWLAKIVLKPEFESSLQFPPTTGFIEFVAVRKTCRRQGIASLLLRESMNKSSYEEFVLDVIAENTPAKHCYEKIGFRPFKSEKKRNGYTKMFMRCSRKDITIFSRI